jgi:hypothetical protein
VRPELSLQRPLLERFAYCASIRIVESWRTVVLGDDFGCIRRFSNGKFSCFDINHVPAVMVIVPAGLLLESLC